MKRPPAGLLLLLTALLLIPWACNKTPLERPPIPEPSRQEPFTGDAPAFADHAQIIVMQDNPDGIQHIVLTESGLFIVTSKPADDLTCTLTGRYSVEGDSLTVYHLLCFGDLTINKGITRITYPDSSSVAVATKSIRGQSDPLFREWRINSTTLSNGTKTVELQGFRISDISNALAGMGSSPGNGNNTSAIKSLSVTGSGLVILLYEDGTVTTSSWKSLHEETFEFNWTIASLSGDKATIRYDGQNCRFTMQDGKISLTLNMSPAK